jgi:Protein of unknown function (DUF3311)
VRIVKDLFNNPVKITRKSQTAFCGMLESMEPATMKPATQSPSSSRRAFNPWYLLLILPYLGLCFPSLYARATPTLFGFPFFYWYQFSWVVLASLLIAIVYKKTKPDLGTQPKT